MSERFTDRLRRQADAIWQAQHGHPFMRGIGDGSLDVERFMHFVRQDYVYLIEYARLLALAAARAPDLEAMTPMAELAHETLKTEMSLHRAYAREFGISEAELAAEAKAPTCQAYTDFLLRTAALGSFGELVAALLPCMWGYAEVGQRLKARGLPKDKRYAAWIETYASPEFDRLAQWCRDVVDQAAQGMPQEELRRMEEAFLTSSRYELLFWEMAWKQERWPL
jgi:thiaminase/transcriptional activator TenA